MRFGAIMALEIHFDYDLLARHWAVVAYDDVNGEAYTLTITQTKIDELCPVPRAAHIPRAQMPVIVSALMRGLAEAKLIVNPDTSGAEIKAVRDHLEDMRKLAKVK